MLKLAAMFSVMRELFLEEISLQQQRGECAFRDFSEYSLAAHG